MPFDARYGKTSSRRSGSTQRGRSQTTTHNKPDMFYTDVHNQVRATGTPIQAVRTVNTHVLSVRLDDTALELLSAYNRSLIHKGHAVAINATIRARMAEVSSSSPVDTTYRVNGFQRNKRIYVKTNTTFGYRRTQFKKDMRPAMFRKEPTIFREHATFSDTFDYRLARTNQGVDWFETLHPGIGYQTGEALLDGATSVSQWMFRRDKYKGGSLRLLEENITAAKTELHSHLHDLTGHIEGHYHFVHPTLPLFVAMSTGYPFNPTGVSAFDFDAAMGKHRAVVREYVEEVDVPGTTVSELVVEDTTPK